jgi:hypothetical protein
MRRRRRRRRRDHFHLQGTPRRRCVAMCNKRKDSLYTEMALHFLLDIVRHLQEMPGPQCGAMCVKKNPVVHSLFIVPQL